MEGEAWKRFVGAAGKQNRFLTITSIRPWLTGILESAKNAKRKARKPPESGVQTTIENTINNAPIFRIVFKLELNMQKQYKGKAGICPQISHGFPSILIAEQRAIY